MNKIICLLLLFGLGMPVYAQNWKWNVGINNSYYQFINSSGQNDDFVKAQSGISASLSRNAVVLDTIQLISKVSKSSFYFTKHTTIAKIVSLFHYEYGLDLKQFNAVGNTQAVNVSYNTHFASGFFAFGPEIKWKHGYSFNLYGRIAAAKMLGGVQQLNNQYLDLVDNEMFKPVHVFTGYSFELSKQVAERMSFFVQYQQSNTHHSQKPGQGLLNFQSTNYSFGIRVSKF